MDLPSLHHQQEEWDAWRLVVAEWRRLLPELDMNHVQCDPLVRAIEVWAETLVALRLTQDPAVVAIAKADKVAAYAKSTGAR